MIKRREVALAIILTLVTCGLYGIYWFIVLVDDVNKISKKPNPMSGALSFLLGIITCGIFILYTYYRMGDDLDNYFVGKGNPPANKGILYLVLSLLGVSIISTALIQNDLNNIADNYGNPDIIDVTPTSTSSQSSGVDLEK